jgi:hypothetical protein
MINAMPILFFILLMTNPVLVVSDSTLYRVDLARLDAVPMTMHDEVIDYVLDDFLYVLTRRFLWRLDPASFKVVDRTLLPERFNYLAVRENEIILIATEEVITVDKKTLSFKSGVGIEAGDYQPIVDPRDLQALKRSQWLYLKTDAGNQSILKVFNLANGRLVRKITVSRIVAADYSRDQTILWVLDVNNRLTGYGLDLKKRAEIALSFTGADFKVKDNGFLVYNDQGVFGINRRGRLIDFQPLPSNTDHTNSFFKCPDVIAQVDLFALRVRRVFPVPAGLTGLAEPADGFGLTLTRDGMIAFLDPDTSEARPLMAGPAVLPSPIMSGPAAGPDSLWYFQVGAFANRDNARKLYEEFRGQGLPVFIDSLNLCRVKLGGFSDKAMGFDIVQGLNLNGWFVYHEKIKFDAASDFAVNGQAYMWQDGVVRRKE